MGSYSVTATAVATLTLHLGNVAERLEDQALGINQSSLSYAKLSFPRFLPAFLDLTHRDVLRVHVNSFIEI